MMPDVPPTTSGVTYSPTVGMKTSSAAAIVPGADNGRVMRKNRSIAVSPRSVAASSRDLSIFSSET